MRVFTDLNLNADTPLRIQPESGQWGPVDVQATRRKKRNRWMWVVAFVVVAALLFLFGSWVYGMIMNSGG
ncbi:MAG: hypothetical protein LBV00_02220 [Propionibacteriaceae bacterium]|nr:hypothetical protein [Propionibacteriaceae bacterium]